MNESSASPPQLSTGEELPSGSRLSRVRRRLPLVVFPLISLGALGLDIITRGTRLLSFTATQQLSYAGSLVVSSLFWASLLGIASTKRGMHRHLVALSAVLAAALVIGGQRYFYMQYGTYLNVDAACFGASVGTSVRNQLGADLWNFARYMALPGLAMLGAIVLTRRSVELSAVRLRIAWAVFPTTLLLALVIPWSERRAQASSPDIVFLRALAGLTRSKLGKAPQWVHATTRNVDYLPVIASLPTRARNVLFVITESARADAICSAHDPKCRTTPFTNSLVPQRIALKQLRAVDSATAISISVLWSGMPPDASAQIFQSTPLIFEYAHAAGWQTAYITSQNLDFAESRAFIDNLPLTKRCEAQDLEAEPDIDVGAADESATERALHDIAELGEPYLAVVHYSNTHFPYRVEDGYSPFQPSTESKDPGHNEEFRNRYLNSIYFQDKTIAELIRGVRAMASGERTVIVFTSDHGEAFREHLQLGHTHSIHDEEIHVPGWIDAPSKTLSTQERQSLETASGAFTWHLDFVPTLLDLMGIWDAPEIARYRPRMLGSSLLRGLTTGPLPITNCTTVWPCPFRNWGMMRDKMKVAAREWDADWQCFDVLHDPQELNNLGTSACGDLASLAKARFGKLPRD